MEVPSAGSITLRLISMEVARRTCHREVRPEHLFIAICELADSDAKTMDQIATRLDLKHNAIARLQWERRILRRALKDSNIDAERTARQLLAQLGRGPDVARETQTYHRDSACKEIYRVADRLCRACHGLSVEPLHVLWAVAASEDKALSECLVSQGVYLLRMTEVCEQLSRQTFTPGELATRTKRSTTPFLDKIGKDLTALARNGELPQIVGMTQTVLALCRGLLRMDKGAVLMLGEPGVGKTAAVEAFAQAIADRSLPGVLGMRLGHIRIIEVPLGALVADTGLRGQFEERVQTLLDEARQNLSSVVLFIDEIHLMMGAGATQQGGMDVGNLFKPAMSRGELRLIGATTPDECARFLEKDPALMRRWERVNVEESDSTTTVGILLDLSPSLADHYRLVISERALQAAYDLAERFIHDRRQPAKSLDLLHEACAHMMCLHHDEAHWKDPSHTTPSPERLILTRQVVAEIVAKRCKLPVSRVLANDDTLAAEVRAALASQVFGQNGAINAVMDIIARAAQGLTDPGRPDGVILLAGPSGTGKTELAQTVAHAMFGERQERFIVLDMSEFSEPSQVARLIGAAPGYTGFEQGGVLTEAVRQHPYSVLVLDGIDRACPEALKLLIQIFDRGRITDSQGRTVDFTNTLIFMTVSVSATSSERHIGMGQGAPPDPEALKRNIARTIRRRLSPALTHHIDKLVVFQPLDRGALRQIAEKLLGVWRARLAERHLTLSLTDDAYETLINAGSSPTDGARSLRRIIEQHVIQSVADLGVGLMDSTPRRVIVGVSEGRFVASRQTPE